MGRSHPRWRLTQGKTHVGCWSHCTASHGNLKLVRVNQVLKHQEYDLLLKIALSGLLVKSYPLNFDETVRSRQGRLSGTAVDLLLVAGSLLSLRGVLAMRPLVSPFSQRWP